MKKIAIVLATVLTVILAYFAWSSIENGIASRVREQERLAQSQIAQAETRALEAELRAAQAEEVARKKFQATIPTIEQLVAEVDEKARKAAAAQAEVEIEQKRRKDAEAEREREQELNRQMEFLTSKEQLLEELKTVEEDLLKAFATESDDDAPLLTAFRPSEITLPEVKTAFRERVREMAKAERARRNEEVLVRVDQIARTLSDEATKRIEEFYKKNKLSKKSLVLLKEIHQDYVDANGMTPEIVKKYCRKSKNAVLMDVNRLLKSGAATYWSPDNSSVYVGQVWDEMRKMFLTMLHKKEIGPIDVFDDVDIFNPR